jgi:hypothetical protein
MKPRRDGTDNDGLFWSQQKHPRSAGARTSVISFLPDLFFKV